MLNLTDFSDVDICLYRLGLKLICSIIISLVTSLTKCKICVVVVSHVNGYMHRCSELITVEQLCI